MGTFTRIRILNVAIVTNQFRVTFVDVTISRQHAGKEDQVYGTIKIKFIHFSVRLVNQSLLLRSVDGSTPG